MPLIPSGKSRSIPVYFNFLNSPCPLKLNTVVNRIIAWSFLFLAKVSSCPTIVYAILIPLNCSCTISLKMPPIFGSIFSDCLLSSIALGFFIGTCFGSISPIKPPIPTIFLVSLFSATIKVLFSFSM